MVWLMAACVVVAVGIWRTRPADRAKAFFPLGLSAVMGSIAAKDRDVWLSMALSLLAIALFLTSLWLQRPDRRD
ncbi:hypothetical protein [Gemmatimonas sp.]|jgi:hypothetical protein|uniref:hypothetical protein n=2 Tax=Gemmatimonas sp. TaxID=1962908 RepID=UPI0022C1C3C8|nr:hypothetical protein [Gemmatimonas sp.]MCZ8267024.1 hypothetical protein [Gemmatimonas sp.]